VSSKLFAFNVSKKIESERLEEKDYEWVGDNIARGCHVVGHCTSQNYGAYYCTVFPGSICQASGSAGYYICDGWVECP